MPRFRTGTPTATTATRTALCTQAHYARPLLRVCSGPSACVAAHTVHPCI